MAKKSKKPAAKGKSPSPKKAQHSPKPQKAAGPPSKWRTPLTHLGIILGFAALLAVYFSPMLSGKVIFQSDLYQVQGMAQDVKDYIAENGDDEPVLWTNGIFSGMPTFQIGSPYPGNLFRKVDALIHFGIPQPFKYIFTLFVGFYLLLLVMRVNPWLSAVGAFAFAFSSYFFIILEAGHTSKANALSYIPFVMAGIMLTYQGKYLLGGALTAFSTALELNANHFQITYYFLLTFVIIGIALFADALKKQALPEFFKATAVLLLAAILGFLPNTSRIWTTYEYADETMRGKAVLTPQENQGEAGLKIDYALSWSYGIDETLTLLVPNFMGGSSQTPVDRDSDTAKELRRKFGQQANQLIGGMPTYWGDQPFTSGPVYIGAIIFFLFVLGLMVVDGPMKWALLMATLLSFMMAWGRHFMPFAELLFYNFPLYNKFRAVAMTLVIAEFTMPLLGIMALQRIMDPETRPDSRKLTRSLGIAAGVTGGLCLIFLLMGSTLFSFSGRVDSEQLGQMPGEYLDILYDLRVSLLQTDAFRSLVFITAAAAAIFLFVTNRLKSALAVYAIIGGLTIVDMWTVNKRYLNNDNFKAPSYTTQRAQPSPADNFILQDKAPHYRVMNLASNTFNEAQTSFHHKSVGGYHAAKFRRYQDLIERHISREMQMLKTTLQSQPSDSSIRATLAQLRVHNMLNTKYFIYNPKARPLVNPSAYGNAWFVRELQTVNSPDEEIAALNRIDPQQTAVADISQPNVVTQTKGFTPQPDPSATISLTAYAPHKITYQTNTQKEQLAVFSEVYYNSGKGWQFYLDGEPMNHFRVNYVLRAARVPAGKHTIECRFEPDSYFTGETISLIFSILVIVVFLGALGFAGLNWWRGQQSGEA
ncbi:MAG: hypothetical protein AAGI38_15025 [Bacteroidota bacterium]